MADTALSPRLRHLLIQEDRQTGRLIHPPEPRVRSPRDQGRSPPLSPEGRFISPVPSAKPSPGPLYNDRPRTLPPLRPSGPPSNSYAGYTDPYAHSQASYGERPSTMGDPSRRPSNLFNLLNDLHVQSPPSSAGSVSPRNTQDARRLSPPNTQHRPPSGQQLQSQGQYPHQHQHQQQQQQYHQHQQQHPYPPHPFSHGPHSESPHFAPLSGPLTAPIIERPTHQPYFSTAHRGSEAHVQPPRPEMFRRHSAHPYEVNPTTNRIVYKEFDFSPVGSRAPISRTTKACNACRARKVRCDAGGGSQGSEPSVCSRCRESGVECVYSGVQKKRGPCPGTTRPTLAQRRRGSQKGNLTANVNVDSTLSNGSANEELSPPSTAPPALSTKGSIQSVAIATPPEGSPPYSSRSSYGFPAPPKTMSHVQSLVPGPLLSPYGPQSFVHQQSHPPFNGSGDQWSSNQPRALSSSSGNRPTAPQSSRPSSSRNGPDSRPPTGQGRGNWQPAQLPPFPSHPNAHSSFEPRVFQTDYTMRPVTHDGPRREDRNSVFGGGGGRKLPPLSVAIDRRTSYHEPNR